jgi:hypothetical protein
MILDTLAGSRYSYDAGTSGTVTVPASKYVTAIYAYGSAAAAGSLTITPGGANQKPIAGSAITIPAGVWFVLNFLGQLGPGSVLVFATTDSYYVEYATMTGG